MGILHHFSSNSAFLVLIRVPFSAKNNAFIDSRILFLHALCTQVVMALHEKNLPFDSKIINLIKSEQYQPWFLYLNPRGEVPVLQDTGKIIPDSARIIEYLEDNFSNGDTPRLIPMDQGPEVRQKVTHFRHVLQKAPQDMLTTGAMLNQHMLRNPKTPFFAPVRKALANAEKNGGKNLRQYAEKNPEHKEVLLKKAQTREETYKKLCVEKNFLGVLEEMHVILEEVEGELAKHNADFNRRDWWLCSSRFTIADVELTILLVRISQLGLEHVFWEAGKRPYIERYYERVKLRDSFKKTVPGTLVLLKTILMTQAPIIIGVVAALALVVGGAIIAAKFA
ncbi:ganglioside-induced differentiation-associated protein 1 isoform X2 [Zophobas morio]|uniref:ganglioside-induced differentiation-associated protein 1 isoform X2 n=1 Tax=Zophobas morio TaxID=2755281 RepID=UPI003082867D